MQIYNGFVWDEYDDRKVVPEALNPDLTERAKAHALLAAFGSDAVSARHRDWEESVEAIEQEVERLVFNFYQDGSGPDDRVSQKSTKTLREDLHPREAVARTDLADVIARELGHRA